MYIESYYCINSIITSCIFLFLTLSCVLSDQMKAANCLFNKQGNKPTSYFLHFLSSTCKPNSTCKYYYASFICSISSLLQHSSNSALLMHFIRAFSIKIAYTSCTCLTINLQCVIQFQVCINFFNILILSVLLSIAVVLLLMSLAYASVKLHCLLAFRLLDYLLLGGHIQCLHALQQLSLLILCIAIILILGNDTSLFLLHLCFSIFLQNMICYEFNVAFFMHSTSKPVIKP